MKAFLVVLFFIVLKANSQEIQCKTFVDIPAMEQKNYEARLNQIALTNASDNYAIYYARFLWKINPAIKYIDGVATLYFKTTSTTDSIVLDLSSYLMVDSIKFRNQNINYSQKNNNTLTVQFNATLSNAQQDSVSIYYKGIPDNSGFGSFIQTTHNNVPVIWTLSEPFGSKDWFPCRNGLDNKMDSIDIFIVHPSIYKATSNGVLQYEKMDAGFTTTYFKHRYPIASYLIAIAVTNFSVLQNTVQLGNTTLPFILYIYPENVTDFQNSIQITQNALQLFHTSFGDYPFINEQYGQTQFGWGGGMEHQTNSFVTSPDENLLVHELAHQWFGDKITCSGWQNIWLNEGFATFCANYYFEKFNTTKFQSLLTSQLNDIVSQLNGSVYVKDTTNVGSIFNARLSYNKAAYILRMLRFNVGDSIFFKALREYLNDSQLKYNFANTNQFKQHVEAVAQQDLSWFFNQWIYGEGYPSFHVSWSQSNNYFAKIKISQTTSHNSVSYYQTLLPLTFKNAIQQKTVVVQCNNNNDEIWADIGFAADTVLIDTEKQLISKNNSTEKINTVFDFTVDDIVVYPNPVKDYINIHFKKPLIRNTEIELFSASGQLLHKTNYSISVNNTTLKIPAQLLSNGMYIIKITTENGLQLIKKLIK
ncbi:MAG: T9SS type A sorting domain-containing protein [Chitinophagales bacterium]|nr:T9SS type A sorting domain-containing protein [Chitinophagales bacterium]